MATKRVEPLTGRPSKVRFVMIEAEINPNDSLSDLTAAIVQAVRQSPSPARSLPAEARTTQPVLDAPSEPLEDEGLDEQDQADLGETERGTPAKSQRPKAKLPVPNYMHDLFGNGKDAEFKAFAQSRAVASHMKRYLLAALWLRDHGDSPTVNIDKMYTCYRTAGWPVGISDWDSNFRSLVKVDKLRRTTTGEYAITPLGESDLQKI